MPDVLIHGDTLRRAEMRHEVALMVPDPFLYAESAGSRHVIVSSLTTVSVPRPKWTRRSDAHP